MPKQAIISFDGIGFGFSLLMQLLRNAFFIRTPVVTHDVCYAIVFNGIPELSPGVGVAGTHNAVEKSFPFRSTAIPIQQTFFWGLYRYAFHPFRPHQRRQHSQWPQLTLHVP
jgi:hypothetical protein